MSDRIESQEQHVHMICEAMDEDETGYGLPVDREESITGLGLS